MSQFQINTVDIASFTPQERETFLTNVGIYLGQMRTLLTTGTLPINSSLTMGTLRSKLVAIAEALVPNILTAASLNKLYHEPSCGCVPEEIIQSPVLGDEGEFPLILQDAQALVAEIGDASHINGKTEIIGIISMVLRLNRKYLIFSNDMHARCLGHMCPVAN